MIAASRTAPTKRVYFYGLTGNRPVALIDVSLVGAPFPSELQGNPPPVVEWQVGGEVSLCEHPFHLRETPQNTTEKITELREMLVKLGSGVSTG